MLSMCVDRRASVGETRHVVIVGAGYGGVKLASLLKQYGISFNIIDSKDFFFVNVAALRAVIYNDFLENIMIPLEPTFGDRFIKGKVTRVDFTNRTVRVTPTRILHYTDLVFAVGSRGPFPGRCDVKTTDEVRKLYSEISTELDQATDVVIIGGGPVGVELAGEIAERYSHKLITLIHPHENLASKRYVSLGFQQKIKTKLKKLTVEVIRGRVSNLEQLSYGIYTKQTVQTVEGESYPADIVFLCTGLTPERSLTKMLFDDDKFDRFFRLKVSPEFKVIGFDDVYAIGDCCNTPEEKMAIHAMKHAECVAKNICRELKGEPSKPYEPYFDGMLVSIGSRGGAGVINGWSIPNKVVSYFKSRTLMYPMFWKLMGQKVPEYDF